MGERIDAEGRVIDQHRAPEEADYQAGPAGNEKANDTEGDRWQEFKLVQPHEFWIAHKIGYLHQVGLGMPARKNPSHVAVEKAAAPGRMHVQLGIGMQVVVPVLGGPPQNALLRAAQGEKCEDELKHSAGGVGPMRKVAVVTRADGKDAQPIKRHADRNVLPGDTGPDRCEAGQMHQHEREGGRINDVVVRSFDIWSHISDTLRLSLLSDFFTRDVGSSRGNYNEDGRTSFERRALLI
jgi:hypothetical protein